MSRKDWEKKFDINLRLDLGFSLSKLMTVLLVPEIDHLFNKYPLDPQKAINSIDFDNVRFNNLFK